MSSTNSEGAEEPLFKYEKGDDFYDADHYSPFVWKSIYFSRGQVLPWIISTSIFFIFNLVLVTYILTILKYYRPSPFGYFESGFNTDLDPAKAAIEGHKIRFTGELKFYENNTMYRDYPEGEPRYFGPPNPEIDNAWHELLYASAVDLPEEEAQTIKDFTWEEPQGGLYRTGLDVFHVLHCLDFVRRSLDTDYYKPTDVNRLYFMHRDHCLDYIRQSIMCHADATPVRLEWRKESHFLIPKFDGYHTCRNFELLHQWSKERALELHNDENQRLIDEKVAGGVL